MSDPGLVKWEIHQCDGGGFSFTRTVDGKLDEVYLPQTTELAAVYAIAVIHGFQPPRGLIRQDIPFDQTLSDSNFQPVSSLDRNLNLRRIFERLAVFLGVSPVVRRL